MLERFVDERYARRCGLHLSNISNGFQENINRIYIFQEGVENNASYEWLEKLDEIVKYEKVYLLLEEAEQKHWIAECNPKVVHLIINEALARIDYYITDKKFNWLITQNHHDCVQFIGNGLDVEIIKEVCTK